MIDSLISWNEWEETYKPITNVHSRDQWPRMFETFEPDIDIVKEADPNTVWTLVDNNPNSIYLDIVPGVHWANRMGYFITEKPWEDKDMTVSNDPSYKE